MFGSQGNYHARGASSSGVQGGRSRGRIGGQRAQRQAYAVTGAKTRGENVIVDGMVLISNSWTHALFDAGATHSFISTHFVSCLLLEVNLFTSLLSNSDEKNSNCHNLNLFVKRHQYFNKSFKNNFTKPPTYFI